MDPPCVLLHRAARADRPAVRVAATVEQVSRRHVARDAAQLPQRHAIVHAPRQHCTNAGEARVAAERERAARFDCAPERERGGADGISAAQQLHRLGADALAQRGGKQRAMAIRVLRAHGVRAPPEDHLDEAR